MFSPKVFVLVPSYNHAPFVERCLRSIFRQTLLPAKLLVIDDGSRDDSVKIIKRTLAGCPFPAQLIARENLGLCRTLNEGFAHSADCEFFAYLGSDDIWLAHFLERRTRQLQANSQAVMAYGNAFLIDDSDRVIETSADWGIYESNNDRKMLLSGSAPISSSVFYRRAALEKVRWNEDARLEDFEFYLKLINIGEFVFNPEVHAAWRQHDYNTSSDIQFMRREVLDALRRNAAALQIDAAQMKSIEPKINLNYAEILARRGLKKESWRLALKNWRAAAKKPALTLRILTRLLLPHIVFETRHNWRQRQSAQRFGKLKV